MVSSFSTTEPFVCFRPTAGLYLHARFQNLPLQLISKLHRNVVDDLRWITEKEKQNQESMDVSPTHSSETDAAKSLDGSTKRFSSLQYILLLSPVSITKENQKFLFQNQYVSKSQQSQTSSGPAGNTVGVDISDSSSSLILFDNCEDEIFFQESIAALVIRNPLHASEDGGNRARNEGFLAAIVVPVEKLEKCLGSIDELFPSFP